MSIRSTLGRLYASRRARVVVGVLAALVLVLAVVHGGLSLAAGAEARGVLAAQRAAGLPMTPAEILPTPRAGEDAWPDLERAMVAMTTPTDPFRAAESGGKPEPGINAVNEAKAVSAAHRKPADLERAKEYFASDLWREVRAHLHDAAGKPACAAQTRYEESLGARLPHLGAMRIAARALALHAELATDGHRSSEVVADLTDGFALAHHAASEPLLISVLVGGSMAHLLELELRSAIANGTVGATEAEALAQVDPVPAHAADFARAIDGERIFFGRVFTERHLCVQAEMADVYGSPLLYPLRMHDYASYLRAMGDYRAMFLSGGRPPAPKRDYLAPLTSTMSPAVALMRNQLATAEANAGGVRLALALVRHRAAHGAYPQRLDDLVPGVLDRLPPAPIDGGRYDYELGADGSCTLTAVIPTATNKKLDPIAWHCPP